MNKTIKQLLILYLIIVILKISLAYFIPAPSAFSDDYGYAKVARSFFYYDTFALHGDISARPPLYSLLLSPSYFFKDMEVVYLFMKIINAIISSSIIFPAWWLSREFFNEKKAMLLTIMIAVLPTGFGFTFFLMQENLFYPLFLLSVFLIYESFIKKSYKWDILAGVSIGLTYLTKIHAIVLPIIVIVLFLQRIFKKDYKQLPKKLVMAAFFIITITPWLIRNGLLFGFSKDILLESYGQTLETTITYVSTSQTTFLLIFLTWFILYLGYLIIATGFVFFTSTLITLYKPKNDKVLLFSLLTITSLILFTGLASRHFHFGLIKNETIFSWLAGRLIGRYVDAVIPLIMIAGMIGMDRIKNMPKTLLIILSALLVVSSQLVFFPLFPVNNMAVSWLGLSKLVFDLVIYQKLAFTPIFSHLSTIVFSALLVLILAILIRLCANKSQGKILTAFIIFFSLMNILNFTINYYNSYTYWYEGEQMQLGLWFNKYDPEISTVLFDERDGCKIFKDNQTCIYNPFTGGGFATVAGFWMNDEIKIGSVDNLEGFDYVVSRHKLDLPLLKETKNGIFLYKTNRGVSYD